jgi:hypothetical protein
LKGELNQFIQIEFMREVVQFLEYQVDGITTAVVLDEIDQGFFLESDLHGLTIDRMAFPPIKVNGKRFDKREGISINIPILKLFGGNAGHSAQQLII